MSSLHHPILLSHPVYTRHFLNDFFSAAKILFVSGQFALLGFEALFRERFFSVVAALVFHIGEWDSNRLEAQVAAEKTILVVEKRDDRMRRRGTDAAYVQINI